MYEPWHMASLRKMALDKCYRHIVFDDDVTDGISIGPVSQHNHALTLYQKIAQFLPNFVFVPTFEVSTRKTVLTK